MTQLLVGVDGSESGWWAVRRARLLGEVLEADVVACLVAGPDAVIEEDDIRRQFPDVGIDVRSGSPFVELIRAARSHRADLLLVSAYGLRSTGGVSLGATTDRVARKADRPVLVVRRPPHAPYATVVVGVDGSSDAREAASLARRLAPTARHLAVHAYLPVGEHRLGVHGVPEPELQRYRQLWGEISRERLEAMSSELELDDLWVAPGRPDSVIEQAAAREAADLIAVGRRGTSGLAAVLLGSTAHHLVHEAPCDVLVYRPATLDFELP
jgi:nucleotide-binding universal stress UspA family protein